MNWRGLCDTLSCKEHAFKLGQEAVSCCTNGHVASVVILATAIYVFQQYVSLRQHRLLAQKTMPDKVKAIVKPEEFEKARLYSLDKSTFSFVAQFVGFLDIAYFIFALYPKIWRMAGQLALTHLGQRTEIRQSLVFLAIMTVIGKIVSLPLDLYMTFVIEKRHGFNKQTISLFFSDMLKGLVLTAALGGPFVAALIWIVRRFGERFYLAVWLFAFVSMLFLMLIFPTFIQPLFNKFEPLPEGSLRTKIEALAKKLSFPLSKIFVMDGSKRSSHSNAYFFGFFSKRIVLFDTLIQQNTEEEICAVLGHELGHWKCWHTFKMMAITQVHMFAIFYGFSRFMGRGDIYEAFGFQGEMPVIIGLMLFSCYLSPIEVVVSFLMHLYSRKNEFEADRFAVNLGYGELMQSALVKLQVENKGNMNPDWMYSAMHYSHPPLIERLQAIKTAMKKEK